MPVLDWIFLSILVFSLLLGLWRGLVYEVLSLLGWLVAFVAAQWLAPWAGAQLPMTGASETVRYLAGFVVVFVLTVFACGLLNWLVGKLVAGVGLRPVDRVLGAVFGGLRGVVIALALVVVIGLTPMSGSAWWHESAGARLGQSTLKTLKPVLPETFGKYLP